MAERERLGALRCAQGRPPALANAKSFAFADQGSFQVSDFLRKERQEFSLIRMASAADGFSLNRHRGVIDHKINGGEGET